LASARRAPDLERLFRRHADGLAGAVRGVLGPTADVQEVLQEAFLRAWRALAAGQRPGEPVGWVFVLTLNLARDLRRKASRRGSPIALDEVDEMVQAKSDVEPARRLEGREALAAARAAIHALPEREKEVFLLRTSGELSFAAVAQSLEIPVGTAKTRMRAALASLRARLAHLAPTDAAPRGEAR